MNAADFDVQFNRLTGHFHLPTDANRDQVALDFLNAVQHFEIEQLERGVTELIRTSQDRFWPPLGRLLTAVRSKTERQDRGNGKCATCHGSGWIESAPFQSNGMIYENALLRCPDCGIPAPQYTVPNHRSGLTASEYREWSQREKQPQYMPEGLQAHPLPPEDFTDMRAAMDRLHLKLFGFARPNTSEAKGDRVA